MNVFAVAAIIVLGGMVAQVVPDRGLKPSTQATPVNLRTGKAFALVIATDDYDDKNWPQLQNPVNDARTIAAELKKNYRYEEPDLLLNPTLEQVSARLRAYLQKTFAPHDSLLIFIAGHGKFDESIKEGYLVFKDSKHDDPLNDTYLAHSKLRKVVDFIPSRRILLVIDACFGGTIDDRVATRGASPSGYPQASKAEIIARKSEMKTRLYLTSGGKEYVPDGKPGANSPFAAQLLSALRTYGGDSGLVTFQDLFQRAESAKGPQPQYGWFGTADPGSDFWFATDHVALQSAPVVPEAGAQATEPKIKTRVNPIDGLTYVYIPPGTFTMGCSPGDTQCNSNEKPAEAEEVARGFWLGQLEVTQKAWKELNGGENPSDHRGNQLPVNHLSWKEADAYCKAIGGRLPTEKEWEYAARAGTAEARYGPLDDIAWYEANSGGTPHPGGLKQPNDFGLYDMLGNAWEWTSNKYDYGEGVAYVARGGSWYSKPEDVRTSRKFGFMTPIGPFNIGPGVRCVWTDAPF